MLMINAFSLRINSQFHDASIIINNDEPFAAEYYYNLRQLCCNGSKLQTGNSVLIERPFTSNVLKARTLCKEAEKFGVIYYDTMALHQYERRWFGTE